MDKIYKGLLAGNKRWIATQKAKDPDYFKKLAQGQHPEVLWIGCADSRVPANEITDSPPGYIFVHRNIANLVIHTDMNLLSVLDYAVNVLKVKHVIVCGHYGCGGVLAAMERKEHGIIDNWLRFLKDVYRLHSDELEAIKDKEKRWRRFVELNVIEQVFCLSETSIIQNAWKERQSPMVHGWVYDIGIGRIQDLNVTIDEASDLHEIYRIESPIVSRRKEKK